MSKDIVITNRQLPEVIEDLVSYDKFYSARQPTYRKLLREVKDWQEASDEEKRILKRAQDEADYLIEVRIKLGELTTSIPKKQGFAKTILSNSGENVKTKTEKLKEIGVDPKHVGRLEILARPENRPIIERVKAKARENNELVTQTQILKEIKKPHVVNNSHDDEWYTPPEFIESARLVMGSIDLDPASNKHANRTVKATHIFTEDDNGLEQEWFGNVWLNPPYSSTLVQLFADKVAERGFEQAVVLVNNATETKWFRTLVDHADAIVFKTGRIRFLKHDGERNTPLQGQAFIYYGDNPETFLNEFKQYGWGCYL